MEIKYSTIYCKVEVIKELQEIMHEKRFKTLYETIEFLIAKHRKRKPVKKENAKKQVSK
jgi:hypothetical protein